VKEAGEVDADEPSTSPVEEDGGILKHEPKKEIRRPDGGNDAGPEKPADEPKPVHHRRNHPAHGETAVASARDDSPRESEPASRREHHRHHTVDPEVKRAAAESRTSRAEHSEPEREHVKRSSHRAHDDTAAAADTSPDSAKVFAVELGRFRTREGAEQLKEQISRSSGKDGYIISTPSGFRLQMGIFRHRVNAEKIADTLKESGFGPEVLESRRASQPDRPATTGEGARTER
jgi:cell division septation protein DedD